MPLPSGFHLIFLSGPNKDLIELMSQPSFKLMMKCDKGFSNAMA